MIGKLISWAFVVVILGECLVESQFVNLTQFPGEQCNSKCVKGQNRICYYEWTLELYHAMGPACGNCSQGVQSDCLKPQCIIGDGFQKGVMSINRMIPGPAVHVCEGDLVVIDVKNMAPGTAAAIHWHGLHMVETPYMDGLPFVTQCPISFETSFRYQFYATEPGTHFYHSHSGVHRLNGQYGVLIVRQPDEDNKSIDLYDYDLPEHFILISDWRHEYAENSFPGLPKGVSFPQSILINGRGTFIDRDTLKHNQVPVTIFYVTQGNRYRFNCINAYSLTDIVSVQVEKHSMTVIATDSFDVEPFETHTLTMNAGERYDFVFAATQPSGDYWIRIRGLNTLQPQPTESFALIRYITKNADYKKPQPPFPDYNKPYPTGYSLNSPSATCFYNDKEYCVADLVPLDKDTELVTRKPDYKFVFSFYNNVFPVEEGFIPGKYKRFDNPEGDVIANGVINNKSLIFPPQPILTQYPEVDKSLICDKINYPEKCKGESICECIHLIKIKKNTIVEMSLYDQVNEPSLEHPFHLHGHRFAVMGITNNTANLKEAIEFASIYRKRQPVWKDSVTVPTNGLVVTRFRADNPGIWLMHCHYENHLATGMALLFQVGEPNEWVQAPEAFPKCGNYLPGVREDS